MKWYIQISGEEECLEWLLKTLKDLDPTVVKEDDGTYGLYSSSFDNLEEKEVRAKAEVLIKNLNVLCSIKSKCAKGIKFNTLYYFDEKGHKRAFCLLSATINGTGSVSGMLSGGREVDLEAELMKKYWHLVNSDDDDLNHVFNLFLHDSKSYPGIYKIYDAIYEICGRKKFYDKICPEDTIERLRGSVNNLATVGIEHARHGKKGTQIKNPMYLPEARALINTIFWRWVDLKSQEFEDNQ